MAEFVDVRKITFNEQVVRLLSEDLVRRYLILPIRLDGNILEVAMADPEDLAAMDEVVLLTGATLKVMQADRTALQELIEKYFSVESSTKQTLVDMRLDYLKESQIKADTTDEMEGFDEIGEEQPVVKLLNSIISGAILKQASDIHLEPQDPEMRVRYRVDGVLHNVMNIPKQIEASLVSRAKILADMDITEKRKPQDGHTTFRFEGEEYDLRLSCMPTVRGEKIVLRILDKSRMSLGLGDLGFSDPHCRQIESWVRKPYGIIFITGPTGSGKTTTLYSMLGLLDKTEMNIVTIEDPVEYRLAGINQTQANPQAGITFASGLRAFLRQDPNVIMVGEVRDRETAEIAVQAALTGHLVLSTLHTNDAPSAMTRLMDMGIEPFLLASTVNGVIAQRLARTLCKECHGAGCSVCFQTGMKGRTVVYEVMEITEKLRQLVVERVSANRLRTVMTEEGMQTFQTCGDEKVAANLCTSEEINRVVFL